MDVKAKPCFNCTKRCLGCHGTCRDYLEFQAKNEQKKEKIVEAKKAALSCRALWTPAYRRKMMGQ